jgi:hypothetical protein
MITYTYGFRVSNLHRVLTESRCLFYIKKDLIPLTVPYTTMFNREEIMPVIDQITVSKSTLRFYICVIHYNKKRSNFNTLNTHQKIFKNMLAVFEFY